MLYIVWQPLWQCLSQQPLSVRGSHSAQLLRTEAHLSRHFLAMQGQRVRWVPFPPPGAPDSYGTSLAHKLLAVGSWSEDAQQHQLSVFDLQVRLGLQGPTAQPALQRLASWQHPGAVTDLQVVELGDGEVQLWSASAQGAVCRLQMTVPSAPGASPEEVQLASEGFEGAQLQAWLPLHSGPVSSLSASVDSRQLLTAGLDGRIFILPLASPQLPPGSPQLPEPFVESGGAVSYWAAAWSSHETFVTAGTTGGLECWDKRKGPKPVRRSPLSWGMTGFGNLDALKGCQRRIHCLDVHPSRPFLCATGSSDGTVAVWDLRFEARPLLSRLPEPAGDVLEVRFDAAESYADSSSLAAVPPVLFCTNDGILGLAAPLPQTQGGSGMQQEPAIASVLCREECGGLLSLDVDPAAGQDVAAVVDSECLVYLQRGLQ